MTGLVITLKPLADLFGLGSVIVTSMNGLSGAGRSPGVMGLDILDNLIPFIPKEEEKVQTECRKILSEHPAEISVTCTRVNVLEGHTESVFVSLGRRASIADVRQALAGVRNVRRASSGCPRRRRNGSRSTTTRSGPSRASTVTTATA